MTPERRAPDDNRDMTDWLAAMRREHTSGTLTDDEARPDPFEQFRAWLHDANTSGVLHPNAMTLSTVDLQGRPDGRIVLLKGFDERGFVFYTHRTSLKGRQLAAEPRVALTFFWDVLDRQVRVHGIAEPTTDAESDEYFRSRPRGSQLGALVSNQSAVIDSRRRLEEALAELDRRTGNAPLQRPATWGGYRVQPVEFEFWQGRPNRLHDRIRYLRADDRAWIRERLAP
jgi:pyridoxamine 5'-phosphate oxidase